MISIGAEYLGEDKCRFKVWAPIPKAVKLKTEYPDTRILPLEKDSEGYWSGTFDNIPPGTGYFFDLDGTLRPDPASHFQPEGVHGPSLVIDHSSFNWSDQQWKSTTIKDMIMYELHTGTFSETSDFQGIIGHLSYLKELGINAIEIMPVAQFPGNRNWGYDGVYPFGVQNSYGGPEGLKKLVNEAHRAGIAVILDVVYNHLGPEGNYLEMYGHYFTSQYHTPWGKALNFDDAWSDHVRNYFINNAIYWFKHYHIDGLRLDAVHAINDQSAYPFLHELADETRSFSERTRKKHYLIAESALNDTKIIRSADTGGFEMDSQWSDDFHHAVHALLTGENNGYYADYGKKEHLTKVLQEGYTYTGEYSVFRKRKFGNSPSALDPEHFVFFIQNHDQTGNRMLGERISQLVNPEAQKLAAAALLLSPYIPMIFMGEEWGEDIPFQYFVSHNDPNLIEAVRNGRKEEFRSFGWKGEIPDPQSEDTFNASKLDWQKPVTGKNKLMLRFYRHLIDLRKKHPMLGHTAKDNFTASMHDTKNLIYIHRHFGNKQVWTFMNFDSEVVSADYLPGTEVFKKVLDTADKAWGGPGSNLPEIIKEHTVLNLNPFSLVVYEKNINNE